MILLSLPPLRQGSLHAHFHSYPVPVSVCASVHGLSRGVVSCVLAQGTRCAVTLTGTREDGWTASLASSRVGLAEIHCLGSATGDSGFDANISATVPSPAGVRPEAS